jgi:adenylate kinase
MRVLMIAPPGAGKGTQGTRIGGHFGIPYIAIGELLRDHVTRRTDLGRAVQEYLDRGKLAPDEIVLELTRQAFADAKADGGEYVLDGIPRTMEQARSGYRMAVEMGMRANIALHLTAEDGELVRRLLARAAVQHRSDDTEDVIRQRLELYHTASQPIIAWFDQRGILVSIDAMRSIEQVGREVLAVLEAMRPLVDHVPDRVRRSVDLTGLTTEIGDA